MRKFLLVFGVLFSFFAAPLSAFAQENKRTSPDALEFALNNSIYVLYHEIAHLLISKLEIPILGREENAADNFATLMLMRADTEQTDNALIDSAMGWFLSSESDNQEYYSDDDLYGEHNLDVQRAFQIVCLMVGGDAAVFSDIADEVGLDEERQKDCEADYEQASDSWDIVLKPYINKNPQELEINIIYDRGYGLVSAGKLLQKNQFFENSVANILQKYTLPSLPNMRGKECHEANAYYDNWTGEILFCYELVDQFVSLFEENEIKKEKQKEEKEDVKDKK